MGTANMELPGDPLIILTGPTAVGKSELAVQLAQRIGGEIISADSMQVYRGMDIGSAKITREEMQGVPHYLIDVLDPADSFDVVRFQTMAKDAIREIQSHGHVPILTGGTGFYIQAVLYDIDFSADTGENGKPGLREKLEKQAGTAEGRAELFETLKNVDPASAGTIHPNNIKRVIRALEFYMQTGRRISEHNEEQRQRTSPYRFAYFVLTDDRQKIYERIDSRVGRMLEQGLLEEVRKLQAQGYTRDLVSMQGLGYKEILAYLEGEYSLEEACYILRRDTRHFAKRQLTWFRREPDVCWIDRTRFRTPDEMLVYMEQILAEKNVWTRPAPAERSSV